MTTLEVRHLKLVRYVAQEGSLSGATRHLHLTQPALSHQLKDLEEQLGTPVFYRVGKSMRLTLAGARLLETARQVLGQLERAEDDIQRIAAGVAGTIRISTECYTCYHWLPTIVTAFRQEYPDVIIEIKADAIDRPVQSLLEGNLDLAIVSDPVRDARLRLTPLFDDEKVALVAPGHRFAGRAYLIPGDFAEEHVIVYNGRTSSLIDQLLAGSGVQPHRVSEVQVTEGILELVKAGLGITVLARWTALPDLQAGHLVAVPVTEAGWHRQWSAATLAIEPRPAYLDRFIALLAQNPICCPAGP
jgi:LysR family transcriptional regulator for metE and metH